MSAELWAYLAMTWGHCTVVLILLNEIDTYRRRK